MHSSTLSHLNTEHALLKALYVRARHQHRTQPFVARISQVLRLVSLLYNALRFDCPRRITSLLVKLRSAIETASYTTTRIIGLCHFLPLQTSLLGIYARLFALTAYINELHSGTVGLERERESRQPPMIDVPLDQTLPHTGPVIKSPGPPKVTRPVSQKPSLSGPPSADKVTSKVSRQFTEGQPTKQPPIEKRSAELSSVSRKKKKPKQNAVDEIFSMF